MIFNSFDIIVHRQDVEDKLSPYHFVTCFMTTKLIQKYFLTRDAVVILTGHHNLLWINSYSHFVHGTVIMHSA